MSSIEKTMENDINDWRGVFYYMWGFIELFSLHLSPWSLIQRGISVTIHLIDWLSGLISVVKPPCLAPLPISKTDNLKIVFLNFTFIGCFIVRFRIKVISSKVILISTTLILYLHCLIILAESIVFLGVLMIFFTWEACFMTGNANSSISYTDDGTEQRIQNMTVSSNSSNQEIYVIPCHSFSSLRRWKVWGCDKERGTMRQWFLCISFFDIELHYSLLTSESHIYISRSLRDVTRFWR